MVRKKNTRDKFKRIVIAFLAIILLSGIFLAYDFYHRFTDSNIDLPNDQHEGYLYIPTGTDYDQLLLIIEKSDQVKSIETFKWVASQLRLNRNIHPGRYKVNQGMSNLQLVRLLISGKQTPVRLTLNKFRTREQLVSYVSGKLELDSLTLITALSDDVYLQKYGFNPDNCMAMFLHSTHEFYWNTSLDKFLNRIVTHYTNYWNDNKQAKCRVLNLTPIEVSILASIVEEESNVNDEKPTIASVYLNRLAQDKLLQADPTVKFSLKRFELRRILKSHTEIKSPYNTYLNKGLPPGPICTPSDASIRSVLNPANTDYLFFCADPENPGRHLFASDYNEHKKNAKRFHESLNDRQIFK
jgi:UPF0755 protein